MPAIDEYLAQIGELRKQGKNVEIDFASLPPEIDHAALTSALAEGLPDGYSTAISAGAKSRSKIQLDYGQVKPVAQQPPAGLTPPESIPEEPATPVTPAPTTPAPGNYPEIQLPKSGEPETHRYFKVPQDDLEKFITSNPGSDIAPASFSQKDSTSIVRVPIGASQAPIQSVGAPVTSDIGQGIEKTAEAEDPLNKSLTAADAAKTIGGLATLPGRGMRAAGVTAERVLSGDDIGKAFERGAEAVSPDYHMVAGEKIGAISGDLIGSAPLFSAMEPFLAPAGALAGASRYGKYAIEGGLGNSIFSTLGQMAEKGDVDGKDVLWAAGLGTALGVPVAGAVNAIQALGRLLPAVRTQIDTELNTLLYRIKKGFGIPQETGLVPFDIQKAISEGRMSPADGARYSEAVFREQLAARALKGAPSEAFPDPIQPAKIVPGTPPEPPAVAPPEVQKAPAPEIPVATQEAQVDTVNIPASSDGPPVIKTTVKPVRGKPKEPAVQSPEIPATDLDTMRAAMPRRVTLPILREFAVKDGTAYTSDLNVTVAKATSLKNGLYHFIGKDLVPASDSPDDYPAVWGDKPSTPAGDVDRKELVEAVGRAAGFSAPVTGRVPLNQVMVHAAEDGTIRVVATDGRQLYVQEISGKLKPGSYGIQATKQSVAGISSLSGDRLKVHYTENPELEMRSRLTSVSFDGDDGWVSSRQTGMDYPPYEKTFPTLRKQYSVDSDALKAALKELAPYAKDMVKKSIMPAVSVARKGGNLELSTGTDVLKVVSVPFTEKNISAGPVLRGSLVMPIRPSTDVADAIFHMDYRYLDNAVRATPGEQIFLSHDGRPETPVQITDKSLSGKDELPSKPVFVKQKIKATKKEAAAFEAEYDNRVSSLKKGGIITLSRDLPALPQAGIPDAIPTGSKGIIHGFDYSGETVLVNFGTGRTRIGADDILELGGTNQQPPTVDTSAYDLPVDEFAKPATGKGTLPTSVPQNMGVKMEMEAQTKDKTNKLAFIDKLESAFGVPVRTKATHRFSKNKLGHYESDANLIRLKRWGDLEVLAHEGGHAMDWMLRKQIGRRWLEGAIKTSGVDYQTAVKELLDLDYDQKKRRKHEGYAEFIRHWITTGQARSKAPALTTAFEAFLEARPPLRADLMELRKLYETWRSMGAERRMAAQVDFGGELSKRPEGRFGSAWEWFYDNFIDSGDILDRMEKDIKLKSGKTLRPSQSPLARYTYFKQKARGIAYEMVMKEAVNWKGEVTGPGLADVLKPIETTWADLFPKLASGEQRVKTFITYALSRRALSLAQRGIDSGFDLADAQYVFKKYDNPTWQGVSDGLTKWADNGIAWLVEAGNLSPEEAQIIRDLNPVYLRLKRVFLNDVDKAGSGRMLATNKGVKRIRGSGRAVYNPIESMIEEMANVIAVAQKTMVAGLIGDLAQIKGAGKWVAKIPPPLEAKEYSIETLKDALKKEGWGLTDVTADKSANLDGIATIFMNSRQYNGKANVMAVWRNGERKFYELDPKLYESLQSLDSPKLNLFTKFTVPFVHLLRLGAIDLNPAFAIIKNPFRDALHYAVSSRAPKVSVFNPAIGVYKSLTAKPGDLAYRFEAAGGKVSGQVGYDRAATMAVWDSVLVKNLPVGKHLNVILHPLNTMRDILSIGEAGPRISELERLYSHYRATKPEWSEDDAWIAAYNDAQDVTVNFTRSGLIGKQINQAVPFFNAAMQSIDKVARLAKENPADFAVRGISYIAIPAVAMWAINREKQWYKNMPHEYKYGNFFFEVGDNIYRLPMPFELGTVFGSTFVAALDSLASTDDDNGRRAKAVGNRVLSNLPGIIPAPLGPVLDVATNRDYLGRPIESEGMKYLPTEQRVHAHTMELSKNISAALSGIGIPLSPVQTEYMLNNYTGGLYNQFRILGGMKELSDVPFLGAILVRAPEKPARQLEILFSDLDDLRKKSKGDDITTDELVRLKQLEKIYQKVYRPQAKYIKQLINDDAPIDDLRLAYRNLQESLESSGIE